ncbi:MAG: HAMP domain-containing sensor histidine kinase, partial [Oscillospiraceae bacterium]
MSNVSKQKPSYFRAFIILNIICITFVILFFLVFTAGSIAKREKEIIRNMEEASYQASRIQTVMHSYRTKTLRMAADHIAKFHIYDRANIVSILKTLEIADLYETFYVEKSGGDYYGFNKQYKSGINFSNSKQLREMLESYSEDTSAAHLHPRTGKLSVAFCSNIGKQDKYLVGIADYDKLITVDVVAAGNSSYSCILSKDGTIEVESKKFDTDAYGDFFELWESQTQLKSELEKFKSDMAQEKSGSVVVKDKNNRRVIICYNLLGTASDNWKYYTTVSYLDELMSYHPLSAPNIILIVIIAVILLGDLAAVFWQNKALKLSLKTAQEASDAKSDFLSKMSHEIRTPLNAILGMNELAKINIDDKAEVLSCLDEMESASQHLNLLVSDILDLAKIEKEKMQLTLEPFSLDNMINSISTLYNAKATQVKIKFNVYKYVSNVTILGDELRIKQIIINLISNAFKFTPEGGMVDFIISEKEQTDSDIVLDFAVRDTGSGIKAESLGKIFEAFEQADNTALAVSQGTGLGLAIANGFARLMGGYITAQSEHQVGSEFTFSAKFELTKPELSVQSKEREVPNLVG